MKQRYNTERIIIFTIAVQTVKFYSNMRNITPNFWRCIKNRLFRWRIRWLTVWCRIIFIGLSGWKRRWNSNFRWVEDVHKKRCKSWSVEIAGAIQSVSAFIFLTYTKRINKAYSRTGSLFEHPYERRIIENENYLRDCIVYIHNNPVKDG